jgi:hypothetical protein
VASGIALCSRPHPPFAILQFCERVPMVKGRYDPAASTATSYCWIVWLTHESPAPRHPEFHWLPPCRAKLERAHDVDLSANALAGASQ